MHKAISKVANEEDTKAIMKNIAAELGGQAVYIGKWVDRKSRNRRIREDFNGANIPALCRKYDLSATQIRNILKKKD